MTEAKLRKKRLRVLAVSSGGGHWEQLMRLAPSFEGMEVEYMTTFDGFADVGGARLHIVRDFNANSGLSAFTAAWSSAKIVFAVRPKVIVSTGAAPGVVAVLVGKLLGAKAIWVDSVANVTRLSKSALLVSRVADVRLTQWEHLDGKAGFEFAGSVL